MKKCPVCASLSTDDASSCGVCGENLRYVPFGFTIESIPVQEQQVETSAGKKTVDRNVTVLAVLLVALGVAVLFFMDQAWARLLAVALLITGFVLLALEASGGGEKKGARNLTPGPFPGQPGPPPPPRR